MPTSRNGHLYRPNPPRRLVGPPSWLAPDHLVDVNKMVPAAAAPERPDHLAWRALVLACDYRGADAEPCGCARLHYCLMGKGRKAEGMSIGAVSLADCHACVTSTDPTPTTQ